MAIETTRTGEIIRHGGRTLVPVARTLGFRLPYGLGGFVWNRPLGVLVSDAGGKRFVRVADRTRQIQWLLLAAGLAAAWLLRRGERW